METPIPAILWLVVCVTALFVLAIGGFLWARDGKRDATFTQICSDCGHIISAGGPERSHGLCRRCADIKIELARREHQERQALGASRAEHEAILHPDF